MNEVDKDKNKMISLEEFLDSTKNEDFKRDEEWKTLDKEKVYNDEDLEEFRKQHEEIKMQRLQRQLENENIAKDRVHFDERNDRPVKVMQQQQDRLNPRDHQVPASSDLKASQGHRVQGQGRFESAQGHRQPAESKEAHVEGIPLSNFSQEKPVPDKNQIQGHPDLLQGRQRRVQHQKPQVEDGEPRATDGG